MTSPLRSRRSFLKELAAGITVAPWVTRGLFAQSPNSVIHHATFGCSSMAWEDLHSIATHRAVKVVAGCDVDETKTAQFRKQFPDARIYSDYRELLEKEKDLQSVNVSTPDHMHAPIAVAAMNRGLHIYGQKPLAHDLYEVRRMTEIAREKKVITQMGIQIHSHKAYRTAVKAVQDGLIGKVREVHTWSSKDWGDNGEMPAGGDAVPEGFNWDLWLGVCAERPFVGNGWYHPGNWRRRLDFGTGTFGDMGCHIYDPVFNALAVTAPLSVRSEGAAPNSHSWATDAVIHYIFPGTAFTEGATVKVVWYDGKQRPPKEILDQAQFAAGDKANAMPAQGSIFLGTDGVMILPHVGMPRIVAKKSGASPVIVPVPGDDHWHQYVETVLGKRKACDAHWDYSGPLTEAVLLGSVATRFPKQTLDWDAAAQKFPKVPEADKFVKRAYREAYKTAGL